MNNKKTLVSAVQAALIAGGHSPDIAASATTTQPTTPDTPVTAQATTQDDSTSVEAAGFDNPTATVSEDEQTGPEAVPGTLQAAMISDSPEVGILKEQIQERDDKLIDAKIQIKTLEAQVAELTAATDGMREIVVKSVNAMQVALNQKVTTFEGVGAADLLTAHTNVSADFSKNFPVGGVASVTPPTEDDTEQIVQDHQWAAKLAAVSIS